MIQLFQSQVFTSKKCFHKGLTMNVCSGFIQSSQNWETMMSLVVQWLRPCAPQCWGGVPIPSLIGELDPTSCNVRPSVAKSINKDKYFKNLETTERPINW